MLLFYVRDFSVEKIEQAHAGKNKHVKDNK